LLKQTAAAILLLREFRALGAAAAAELDVRPIGEEQL
jgi:hypothetical protein